MTGLRVNESARKALYGMDGSLGQASEDLLEAGISHQPVYESSLP